VGGESNKGEKKKWCAKTKVMTRATYKQGQVYHLMRGKKHDANIGS